MWRTLVGNLEGIMNRMSSKVVLRGTFELLVCHETLGGVDKSLRSRGRRSPISILDDLSIFVGTHSGHRRYAGVYGEDQMLFILLKITE